MKLPVSEIFEFVRNGLSVRQKLDSGGLPITRIETIADATINLKRVGYAGISSADAKQYLLQDGDILFSHINSLSHLGKCTIYNKELGPLVHGMNLICFRVKSEKLLPKFALYLIRSNHFKSQLAKSIKKSVNQASVSTSDIKKIILNFPPLAEQKRIAALLDTADRILRLRESAIAKLDELEQSMFVEMFGDLINNPNKWPVKKIGNFIEIVMGKAPHSDQCNKEGKGVVFVKAGEFGIDSPIIREWTIDPLKMAKANDILICVVGATAGKINRSRFECAIGRSVASVRSTSIELNQDYLHSFLKTKILELRNRSQGAAQAVITREMLRDIEIPLPPIAKQIEFVSFLKELRNEQNMFSISSKKMSQLQMSLQYQSFAVN